ncbi:MAG: NADH-quinone oxidoreductase subunit NuoE [Thiotrichaceae bacterium]|nr:NADH-quinone oxidoreductase subunit NuoE [Thiotrichaceae bacterium]
MLATQKQVTQLLTPESYAQIDHWLQKYPENQKQSAVMGALMIAQKQNGGHLTEELMDEIAAYLDMQPIAVYEVATFYSMYEHKPVGKHKICVCTNISCMLSGSDEVVDHLKQKLGVKDFREVTKDGKYSLKEVECLGACVNAPVIQVEDQYYEKLTPEKVDQMLAELK